MWAWLMQFVLWRGIRRYWSQAEVEESIYIQIYCQNFAYTDSTFIKTRPNPVNIYAISDMHFVVSTSAECIFLAVKLNMCAKVTNSISLYREFSTSADSNHSFALKDCLEIPHSYSKPFHNQIKVLEVFRLELPAAEHKILHWNQCQGI